MVHKYCCSFGEEADDNECEDEDTITIGRPRLAGALKSTDELAAIGIGGT